MESMATSFIVRENLYGGIPLVRPAVIKIMTAGIPNTEKGTARQDEEIPAPDKNGRQRSPNQAAQTWCLHFPCILYMFGNNKRGQKASLDKFQFLVLSKRFYPTIAPLDLLLAPYSTRIHSKKEMPGLYFQSKKSE